MENFEQVGYVRASETYRGSLGLFGWTKSELAVPTTEDDFGTKLGAEIIETDKLPSDARLIPFHVSRGAERGLVVVVRSEAGPDCQHTNYAIVNIVPRLESAKSPTTVMVVRGGIKTSGFVTLEKFVDDVNSDAADGIVYTTYRVERGTTNTASKN